MQLRIQKPFYGNQQGRVLHLTVWVNGSQLQVKTLLGQPLYSRHCGPDAEQWHEAMQQEMDSFRKHGVWKLTVLPEGRKAIGSKWFLK